MPGQPLQVTICSLVLLVPLLNIESDFSLVFGGLFMNGVALWGLLIALSQLPGAAGDVARGRRPSPRALGGIPGGRDQVDALPPTLAAPTDVSRGTHRAARRARGRDARARPATASPTPRGCCIGRCRISAAASRRSSSSGASGAEPVALRTRVQFFARLARLQSLRRVNWLLFTHVGIATRAAARAEDNSGARTR